MTLCLLGRFHLVLTRGHVHSSGPDMHLHMCLRSDGIVFKPFINNSVREWLRRCRWPFSMFFYYYSKLSCGMQAGSAPNHPIWCLTELLSMSHGPFLKIYRGRRLQREWRAFFWYGADLEMNSRRGFYWLRDRELLPALLFQRLWNVWHVRPWNMNKTTSRNSCPWSFFLLLDGNHWQDPTFQNAYVIAIEVVTLSCCYVCVFWVCVSDCFHLKAAFQQIPSHS